MGVAATFIVAYRTWDLIDEWEAKRGHNKSSTVNFLEHLKKFEPKNLDTYGVQGVNALAAATPVNTGDSKTANSWDYKVVKEKDRTRLVWTNSNVVKGQNIAILLQYGHGTSNGGYVEGKDYINPAMEPVFDDIVNKTWAEVTKHG